MRKPKSIQFILSVGKKQIIPSVNSLYKARLVYNSARKPIAQIYKDTSAKKVISHLEDQMKMIDFKKQAPWIWEKDAIFDLQIQAIFKQNLFKRDSDNLSKLIQDSIFRHLGLNDSRVITFQISKSICPDISEEKICVNLSQSTAEVKFDKLEELPVPEKIYFHETPSPDLQKELGKLKYSWYIGGSGTEEDMTEKNEVCDSHVYLFKESGPTLYEIGQIFDTAHSIMNYGMGSLLVGVGENLKTNEDLHETMDLLNKTFGCTKKIEAFYFDTDLDILKYLGTPKKRRKKSNEGKEKTRDPEEISGEGKTGD